MNSEDSYTSSAYSDSSNYTDTESSNYSEYSSEDDNKYNLHNLEGEILNNYNIIYELGRGGFSIVWLGYNISDCKYYAIKVQNSDDYEDGIDEIRIMKKLKHKNINELKIILLKNDMIIMVRNKNMYVQYMMSFVEILMGLPGKVNIQMVIHLILLNNYIIKYYLD